jgi:molybdopterin/thiamine biosynthesis adenylyltransferase
MTTQQAVQGVIAALRGAGYRASIGKNELKFYGDIRTPSFTVPVLIEYGDLNFTQTPRVIVTDLSVLPRRVFPHVDETGELCVVDRESYLADRYQAPGHALGIIQRARELLVEGATKAATEEIAREFPEHWGGEVVEIRMSVGSGPAKAQRGKSGATELVSPSRSGRGSLPSAWLVATKSRLSFQPDQARPERLGEVLNWAESWDSSLPNVILDALSCQNPNMPICMISAPNGAVGFLVQTAALSKALERHAAAKRVFRSTLGRGLPITRIRGRRTDLPYMLGRSFNGKAPLADRSIVLVGCGSIGGFASIALPRLGAGLGVGSLSLIDPDVLDRANVGRHVLGEESVGEHKVLACRTLIDRNLPGLKVHALPHAVEEQRRICARSDLVIDATGEQGVGEMLNAWRLEAVESDEPWADLLHVWICGHGHAVQSYFSSDPEFSCYRCLWPDHADPPRYWPLREGTTIGPVTGCGETSFTPYGVSAPMMAASLVASHAVDWAQGKPRELLRTHRLDEKQTKMVKPTNPPKSPRCPACKQTPSNPRSGVDPAADLQGIS